MTYPETPLRLRIAYALWSASDALTAIGNWLEDLAVASDPVPFRVHWRQVRDMPGWQR